MITIKKMKKDLMPVIVLSLGLLALTSSPSLAIPNLQMDIAGGTYDSATQAIISSGTQFTLYAYMQNIPLNYTFYLSAALISPTGNPNTTFDISSAFFNTEYNGTGVNNTVNFAAGGNQYVDYGVPPHYDLYYQGYDRGDLPTHNIFPTYFKEFKVVFNSDRTIDAYDTASRAKTGISTPTGGNMYYASFTVDTSKLAAGDAVHFDLYTVVYGPWPKDLDVGQFAPVGYDAQSIDPPPAVPEPSTLMLLGTGLVGLGFWGRRKFKARN